jgi:hypothetical protein
MDEGGCLLQHAAAAMTDVLPEHIAAMFADTAAYMVTHGDTINGDTW